jgi:hypothetical protein
MTSTLDDLIAQIDHLTPAEQARLVAVLAARLARTLSPVPATNTTQKTPEELGWPPGFFEQTYGSLADTPLVIDDAGVDAALDDDPDEIARQLDALAAHQDASS